MLQDVYPKIIKCKKCCERKPLSEFPTLKNGLYISYTCKTCSYVRAKINRLKLIEKRGEIIADMKKCPKCGQVKPASEFYRNIYMASGLSSYCKQCSLEYQKMRQMFPDGI